MPPVPALAALALLLLLPGLLVVRAPWTAVPALSLAFWAVAGWWPPLAWGPRGRGLSSLLLVCAGLALLRLLPKHEVEPPAGFEARPAPAPPVRPGLPPPPLAATASLLVLAVAVALVLASSWAAHAPGPSLAFATTGARLVVWRDGIPRTAEPLLPLAPFGAHAPALATLAADVSLVSGTDPARCALLLLLGAVGLALLGLFALYATRVSPRVAALAAVLALALARWPQWLETWGAGEALVALAFVLPAAALLTGHASRSSAAAAALLLAAGLLAQPLLSLAVAGACAAATGRPAARRSSLARPAAVLALALLLAAPGLWPLAQALSARELAAILASPRTAGLLAFASALLCVACAPVLAARLAGADRARDRAAALLLALACAALLLQRVGWWVSDGQLPASTRIALEAAARQTRAVEAVCAPEGVRDWVPALAGRAAGEPGPWIPPVYLEEWAARPIRPCRLQALVTSFDAGAGNPRALPAY